MVFDFETDSPDPKTCNPVQLAAGVVDPIKLELIPGAEFNSMMRPPDLPDKDDDSYVEAHKSTIAWHAKQRNISFSEVLKSWKAAPPQKDVWEAFVTWMGKFHSQQTRQSKFSAPIACGYNIEDFDMHIIQRLCDTYGHSEKDGTIKIFNPRDKIDLIKTTFWWFESQEEPKNLTMDALREYFGMPLKGGHDALQDIKDEAWILTKLLKTQRWLTNRLVEQGKLKGAYYAKAD